MGSSINNFVLICRLSDLPPTLHCQSKLLVLHRPSHSVTKVKPHPMLKWGHWGHVWLTSLLILTKIALITKIIHQQDWVFIGFKIAVRQCFPTTAPGPQVLCKHPWSAPRKIWNPQYFMLKIKFDSKYEGFFNNFFGRCSATFKRLGNTVVRTSF